MSGAPANLDIYEQWLGVAPGPRPPDHYILLGLEPYEENPDIIRKAARDRMKLVRPRCLKFPDLGTKLLNEIAAAQVCLLDVALRASYDKKLRIAPPPPLPVEEKPIVLELLDEPEFELPDPVPDFLKKSEQYFPFGIDLGVGSISAAWTDPDEGGVTPVPLAAGGYDIPTLAYLSPEGTVRLGANAAEHVEHGEPGSIKGFPRNLGGKPFEFPDSDKKCEADRLCSAAFLHLLRAASNHIGDVERAVIAAPVSFTATQRWAIKEAARTAGLRSAQIIPAPVAACLAYAEEMSPRGAPFTTRELWKALGKKRILVVDQDEISFEGTLLEMDKLGQFQILASEVDELFGGEDWEETFFRLVCEDYQRDLKHDPRKSPKRIRELRRKAFAARRQLDRSPKALLEFVYQHELYEITITRQQFEVAADDLLQAQEWTLRRMLKRKGYNWKDVDFILLVGPYSQMPMIRDMLRGYVDDEVGVSYAPNHAKAIGAALWYALHPRP